MMHHQTFPLETYQDNNMLETIDIPKQKKIYKILGILGIGFLLLVILAAMYVRIQMTAPTNFRNDTSFEILSGMSVRAIAKEAKKQGLVRSETFLYTILTYSYDPTTIYAGTYIFKKPTSVFGVAQKLAGKDIENNLVRLTLPEGITTHKISEIASKILPSFNTASYRASTTGLEGYLFPETYFVPPTFTASDLLELQLKTYEENLLPLRDDILKTNLTEYKVLVLASIVEREANDEESMKMVAGILQNRLAINMPLQADASIEYVLDTPLHELPPGKLASELRELDSPYNTYLNTGLPPTPIGNPGIMAINAVIHPTASDNFFYITGTDGTFHYAKTFEEHNQNIAKYLQ